MYTGNGRKHGICHIAGGWNSRREFRFCINLGWSIFVRSYVRKNMCADNPDVLEIDKITALIEDAELRLAELRIVRDDIKAKLEQLGTVDGEMSEEKHETIDESGLLEDDEDYAKEMDIADRFDIM